MASGHRLDEGHAVGLADGDDVGLGLGCRAVAGVGLYLIYHELLGRVGGADALRGLVYGDVRGDDALVLVFDTVDIVCHLVVAQPHAVYVVSHAIPGQAHLAGVGAARHFHVLHLARGGDAHETGHRGGFTLHVAGYGDHAVGVVAMHGMRVGERGTCARGGCHTAYAGLTAVYVHACECRDGVLAHVGVGGGEGDFSRQGAIFAGSGREAGHRLGGGGVDAAGHCNVVDVQLVGALGCRGGMDADVIVTGALRHEVFGER